MSDEIEAEQDVVSRDELIKVLGDTYASLHAEMIAYLLSLRGITCSAQMSTVEHIARKFGISKAELEKVKPNKEQS